MDIRGVVVCDDDGVFFDSEVTIETFEQLFGEVFSGVLSIGRAKSFTENGVGNDFQGFVGIGLFGKVAVRWESIDRSLEFGRSH